MWKTLDDVPFEIRERYRRGEYSFSPPPVPTTLWTELSWINYIWGARKGEPPQEEG